MGNQNRIWIAIAGIVIIGTAVTAYTNQFVSRSIAVETIQTEAASETPVENELLEESTTAGETQLQPETQAGPGAEPAPAAMARMMEDTETEIAETEMSPVLSPLEENSGASSQEAKTAGLGGRESYEQRLFEIDQQITKMRSQDRDGTTTSMKTVASAELKLWDTELNRIYGDIMDQLSEEEAQDLIQKEREWMNQRDAKAVEASSQYAGGTLEGLEYTASLAATTRDRCYELVETYGDYLTAE